MFWFIATLPIGTVEEVGGTAVVTRFRVFNLLPLFAYDSFVEVRDPRFPGKFPIPLHGGSVRAGYARAWLPVLTGAMAVGALVGFTTSVALGVVLLVGAALAGAAAAHAWLVHGHLSRSEKQKRYAYATWIGVPLDPAIVPLDVELPGLPGLRAFVEEGIAKAFDDYRSAPGTSWIEAARKVRDPALLVAALTLARVERRSAAEPARAALDALHADVWAKLEPLIAARKAPAELLAWDDHFEERRRKHVRLLGLAGAVLGLLGVAAAFGLAITYHNATHPLVVVTNLSSREGLTVTIDGKPVAEHLRTATREGDLAVTSLRVDRGAHEIAAFDATGAEIDRRRFVAGLPAQDGKTYGALLYAPRIAPEVCVVEEVVTYARTPEESGTETVPIDMSDALHPFHERIDYWFERAPVSAMLSNGQATLEQRAVRARPCKRP
jgi:hypothetical protein